MVRSLTAAEVRRVTACSLVVVLGLVATACGGEEVGRSLQVEVNLDLPDSLPVGSPFDIGYTWTPAADFQPPADDFKVYTHLVDPDGEIVMQDDHFPPTPTSQWRAGEPITYRHWVYPEPGFRPDYVDFYVGLYLPNDQNEQIATMHDGTLQNRPLVHTVTIRTDDQSGIPVYIEGFHDRETSLTAEPDFQQWQWMRGKGTVVFGNPDGAATLHLRGLSPVDFTGGSQNVTIRVGDRVIGRIEATDSTPYLQRFDLPADVDGDGDWVEVTLEVDGTFVPAQIDAGSTDTRVLGLQVFWMFLGH